MTAKTNPKKLSYVSYSEALGKEVKHSIPPECLEKYREKIVFCERSKRYYDTDIAAYYSVTGLRQVWSRLFGQESPREHAVDFTNYRLARYVHEAAYFPDQSKVVEVDGLEWANKWTGWGDEPGDIQPFMDYTANCFSRCPVDVEWVLDLVAYRVQNPNAHIPFAVVISGHQASANLWTRAFVEAFGKYGLHFGFFHIRNKGKSWVNGMSLGVFVCASDGFTAKSTREAIAQMIAAPRISDLDGGLAHYTNLLLMMITMPVGFEKTFSNPGMFYALPIENQECEGGPELADWLDAGGGKHLMHHLLNRDISDFVLPATAPSTTAMEIYSRESRTPYQAFAHEMQDAKINYVASWVSESLEWAQAAPETTSSKRVIKNAPNVTIRPWYTAEEIALMFPHIELKYGARFRSMSLKESFISRELRKGGLQYLQPLDDPRGFERHGLYRQYFVVAEHDKWRRPVSQEEFNKRMASFPKYTDFIKDYQGDGS